MNKGLLKALLMFGALLTATIIVPPAHAGGPKLTIVKPRNDARVCWRATVEGTVSDPKLQVYVAVHPMETDKFWIQPVPTVSSNGKWKSYCYFGEPNAGIGQPFEIIAVASGSRTLFKEGDTLPSPLPENQSIAVRSDPTTVTRSKCVK